MAGRNWEDFWGTAWLNLFNALGMVAVVGGMIWFVWALANGAFTSDNEAGRRAPLDGKATQATFNKALLNVPKPCAVRGKKYSDITNCSVFGLRLEMSLAEVKETLDGSGYFPDKTALINDCKGEQPNCAGYVFERTDDFSIQAVFRAAYEGDKNLLAVSEIRMWLDPRSTPYFRAESMPATFVDLFGPPDRTLGDHNFWGGEFGSSVELQLSAYPYKGQFVVILSKMTAAKAAQQ